jgi:hypothetical protein
MRPGQTPALFHSPLAHEQRARDERARLERVGADAHGATFDAQRRARIRDLRFDRDAAREPGDVAPRLVRAAGRRRARAEVERVLALVRVVGDARERLPGRDVGGGTPARVFGVAERAVADGLDRAVRPHEPHGVRTVLQRELDDGIRRRDDARAADDEARARCERRAGRRRPARGPAARPRAVAGLEPRARERLRRRRRVQQLDELEPLVVADGVVEHLGDQRPPRRRAHNEREQHARESAHANVTPRGRNVGVRERRLLRWLRRSSLRSI